MRNARLMGLSLALMFLQCMTGGAAAAGEERGGQPPEWQFELGAGAFFQPDYEGSDDYEVSPVPFVEIAWRDRVRLTTRGGPGLYIDAVRYGDLTLTGGLAYEGGRDEDDNDALKGLGDLEVGAVAKLDLGYEFGPIDLGLGLSRDLGGDREGTSLRLEAEYGRAFLDGRLMLSAAPYLTWADDSYMSNSFGISAAQSAASPLGLAEHDADAALKDAGVGLTMMYRLTDNVMLLGLAGYSRLLGDAADSPIVADHGSADQFSVGAGLVYRW
ncbi:MipA/OmpV family protein [Nisaea acidiphila]|uniref:MipA/OmpV family protein n=1 Tax=Nisaea acidiphila TaxID=1862145 RepID=A0A9J7AQE3_9PROT|nr:MipA/OmpV family protein [Nisaea acidiphila]UUX48817.1 MipA/OmpV family protein [Nisaea acidiphila]